MTRQERPLVPVMLDLLENAYHILVEREAPPRDERLRIEAVIDDLRWYSERLGMQRWEVHPRPGHWSFAENLWHITEQAIDEAREAQPPPVRYFIDHGKEHVGQAAEIFALFEYKEAGL